MRDKAPKRPKKGRFDASRTEPDGMHFPLENAKKGTYERHARNEYEPHARLFHPRG